MHMNYINYVEGIFCVCRNFAGTFCVNFLQLTIAIKLAVSTLFFYTGGGYAGNAGTFFQQFPVVFLPALTISIQRGKREKKFSKHKSCEKVPAIPAELAQTLSLNDVVTPF